MKGTNLLQNLVQILGISMQCNLINTCLSLHYLWYKVSMVLWKRQEGRAEKDLFQSLLIKDLPKQDSQFI